MLKTVTLLVADCINPPLAVKALQRCISLGFAEVKLLSHERPEVPSWLTFVPIPRMRSIRDYVHWSWERLTEFVTTEFVMTIHSDGFVVNPDLWDERFLDYDYIGAPWPDHFPWTVGKTQVGNSGFCIRSKKQLEFCARRATDEDLQKLIEMDWPDDILMCGYAYDDMLSAGMKYAPLELASKFSYEQPVAGCAASPEETFGFHGKLTDSTRSLCRGLV